MLMQMVYLLYLFICQWTFRLLPCPGYCNSAATNIEVHVFFFFLKYDFSPDICHGVGFLNDTVILDKVFLNPRVPQNRGF